MWKPEILAPAGSMEALKAAIVNGADAVYLGGKLFNARQYATNFNEAELEEAVKLAHSRQVKLYVTVNILLHNEELETALKYLQFLYSIGVDAIIVQDLGLLQLAREVVPGLKIHGSTQMTIHNLQGARFFSDKGLERIVLARELSLNDISAIRQGCDLELEVFVHGALCICYSGQCLMSSMIGGRSGNRGKCAQPCRLPYSLETSPGNPIKGEGDYLLSPRDLATIDILPELVASGVHSLKFEGRMKRPEYVATVIRIYRKALDRCLEDPEGYCATREEKRQLAQIFNRDFTDGYFRGNPGKELISYQRPNNRGTCLGRINKINFQSRLATVKLEQPLTVGDGIEYWVSRGGRCGITVKEIIRNGKSVSRALAGELVEIEVPVQARPGDRVFKTNDAELMAVARGSFAEKLSVPKIPVNMYVKGNVGEPLQLVVRDRDNNTGSAQTEFLAEKAKNKPLTKEVLEKQLGRLGNTDYVLDGLFCDIPDNLMVPFSELNAIRRKAIAQLDKARQIKDIDQSGKKLSPEVISSLKCTEMPRVSRTPKLAVTVGDPKSLKAAAKSGADYVYISGEHYRSKKWSFADFKEPVIKAQRSGIRVYFCLPRLWLDSNLPVLQELTGQIARLPVTGLVVGNPAGIQWAGEHFPSLPLVLDYTFNLLNDFSIKFLANEHVESITLSPELNFKEIAGLCIPRNIEFEGIIHGALPLMVSEHCVVGGVLGGRKKQQPCSAPCVKKSFYLRDRKDYRFPVEMDQFCRMHIYNSQELCLIDHLMDFQQLGYNRVRIEARRENADYVGKVTGVYRRALQEMNSGIEKGLREGKLTLEKIASSGLTKGHYFRGV